MFKTSNNWTSLCPTGLTPWIANSNDLTPCFQEVFLQMPTFTLFATFSSYYFGLHHILCVRDRTQLRLIHLRILISICLSIIPIARIFYLETKHVYPSDVLITCTQCIAWMVHVGYLHSLRRYGSCNHRGPLFLNVIWTSIIVLDIIWLRTSFRYSYWPWSLTIIILDILYFITFLPSGNSRHTRCHTTEENERDSLLEHRYVYFNFNMDEMMYLGHAQDDANFASKLLFYWVGPLISKGVAGYLIKIEDLFDLPECLNISIISEKLQLSIHRAKKSLFWALNRTYGKEFYSIGILKFISDIMGFAGPLLLGGLLREQTTENAGTDIKPYLYAVGLFLTNLISIFCSTHFHWKMSLVGMKMRIGVVSAIYRKALEAKGLQNSKPEILNLMSTDTDHIVNSCISFHSFWSIPFQLFTTLYLLYTQVGAAFIAGVIFAILLIPINRWISVKISEYTQKLMYARDVRLSATSEMINGAKQIKLYAWEDIFINKIQKFRQLELKYLSKKKYLDAICVYFWATTPVLMCLLTFGVSVLMGNPLTASTTYTSVALLNMLIGPLNAFPWVLNGLIESWISIKRVQELLNLPNLDFSSYYNPIMNNFKEDSKQSVLQVQNASFEYEYLNNRENGFVFKLENVNIDIKKGELVCIEGPVGSGKSTLILAIAAGINCVGGTVCVHDLNEGFGYVTQNPWLQRETIRENIIWGSVFDEQKYKNIIMACALNEDLEILGGDLIGIGENGRTLSGGQRVRVALARAIYQEKKIYLMDNILSCLDAHVANHIIKYCILGILKDKTRIIVTENRMLFYYSNQILHVENSTVMRSSYMSESIEFSDDYNDVSPEEHSVSPISMEESFNDEKNNDSMNKEETRNYGKISTNVLSVYWNAVSSPLSFAVLLFVILMQLSRNLSDAWLAYWVTETNTNNSSTNNSSRDDYFQFLLNYDGNNNTSSNSTTIYSLTWYLGIYATIAAANSVITFIRAFLFAYAGLKAAKIIHSKLLNRVIHAEFSFFDITSVGRILNRFSSDTCTIDESLPFIVNILLAFIVELIGAVCVSLYAMPWLALIIVPMIPIYINLQYRYRCASRDIKRLACNALSPIYSQFTETVQGLTTIKVMRAIHRFNRDFHVKLEESMKAQLTMSAAQQWLNLRLYMLGSLLIGGAGLLAAITSAHATNPGLVGLSISYALSITSLLTGVLNTLAETEQEMIAVERIDQYLQLELEENADGTADPPFAWPAQGVICFQNVSMRYRENLIPSLKDLNFKTTAFERLAIVGRTGAGKSSILAALLRVAPLCQGNITVDCVNLRTLALKTLRDRISIVPQEPFLFEGTVRDNLDPRQNYLDSEIWNAISNCLATPFIQSLGGLSGRIDVGGKNLSSGLKQLLCLTRALLKNSKIVCIDEGTSNLDKDSDAAIQLVLCNAFKSSTILYIAHRLKGLHKMDRILVMSNSEIVEEGTPKELIDDHSTMFFNMLQEQRNVSKSPMLFKF